MNRGVVLALASACLVVLAGCGGVVTDGTDEPPRVTPAPVPADPTPRPTPEASPARTLAPGVTAEGVVDATRLVGAHVSSLRERSFTTTRREVSYGENGTVRSSVIVEGTVAADRSRSYVQRRTDGPVLRRIGFAEYTERFVAGRTVAQRTVDDGAVVLDRWRRETDRVGGSAFLPDLAAGSTLSLAFHGLNFTLSPPAEGAARTRYRLVSTGVADPGVVVGLAGGDARNVSVAATVSGEGLVSWFRLSYVDADGDRVVRTTTFERVGTATVERPAWVENVTGDGTPGPATPNGTTSEGRTPAPTLAGRAH
jgi:hypothetical protein